MPEQAPPQSDDAAIDPQQQPAGKTSLLDKLKVFAFVLVVIVVECLVAYLWLPDAGETAAMASAALQDEASDDLPLAAAAEEEEEPLADQLEVDLGEFSVTAFQPISNTTLRLDFHLFGTVGIEDEAMFHTLMEENLHRFREQVIVTLRGADLNDLTDAALGLLKRKILEKTNRALGKPLLRTVIFSEFSFVEQ